MKQIHDLRSLKPGTAYDFEIGPSRRRYFGVVGRVVPNMDHPNWGTVYGSQGEYLLSLSYGEWLEASECNHFGLDDMLCIPCRRPRGEHSADGLYCPNSDRRTFDMNSKFVISGKYGY